MQYYSGMRMLDQINQINNDMKLVGGWRIFRRYLVMNAFDGILSVLGVVIGAYFLNTTNPRAVILPGFGVAIAIGVSGSWIAYLTETAESEREQKHLEMKLLTSLDGTRVARAVHTASITNSLVNGFSPFFFGVLTLIPFMLVDTIPMTTAFYLSFVINAFLLFILGVFLARISKKNIFVFGFKTLMAGIVVTIIIFLVG